TLLEGARATNTRLGVTGLLLFHEGSFIQVLEGPPDVVEALYARIETDPRHGGALVLSRGLVEERSFGEWRMG
ncbi:MAG: BLUF domain-containing protein, partial [Gemmatimonadetes bacterium]|nr:BLUF domain-containing protein [Gemmatimonadota bacterium]